MSQSTDGEDGQQEMGDGVLRADRGPNREDMIASYLPDEDHWAAKTALDLNDPAALGALSQFGEMYPEVEDLQIVIDGFLEEFLPAKTSVQGKSRDEYKEIFMSMWGGKGSTEETAAWVAALGGDSDE